MERNVGVYFSIRALASAGFALLALANQQTVAGTQLPACELQAPTGPGPSGPTTPGAEQTTIATVGQAYHCVFDHYVHGPALRSRDLLVPAFVGLTEELQRRGLDAADAQLPAFTGSRVRDWDLFSRAYKRITFKLPVAVRQALAEKMLQAMVESLHDNHAAWQRARQPTPQIGVTLSIFRGPPLAGVLDAVAQEPIFVTSVTRNSPAERAGVRAGDEIVAVDDVPLFVNGKLSGGVFDGLIHPVDQAWVSLTVRRPSTNATLSIGLVPAMLPMLPATPETKLLSGGIVYAKLPGFDPRAVDTLLQNIAALGAGTKLRGVVIDLRENEGGMAAANARLLGAFAHELITGYWCDARDKCTATRTDDSVPLLNLPLVALIDRTCVSACDVFASVVKDANLGRLIGTRTGGLVSGPSYWYALNDGSLLFLPKFYQLGAKRQHINEIGIAPHVYAASTALDLSTGRDPALAKALEELQ
jgi:carboxyl-terminal processing protease